MHWQSVPLACHRRGLPEVPLITVSTFRLRAWRDHPLPRKRSGAVGAWADRAIGRLRVGKPAADWKVGVCV